jgi:hypothetical protein
MFPILFLITVAREYPETNNAGTIAETMYINNVKISNICHLVAENKYCIVVWKPVMRLNEGRRNQRKNIASNIELTKRNAVSVNDCAII